MFVGCLKIWLAEVRDGWKYYREEKIKKKVKKLKAGRSKSNQGGGQGGLLETCGVPEGAERSNINQTGPGTQKGLSHQKQQLKHFLEHDRGPRKDRPEAEELGEMPGDRNGRFGGVFDPDPTGVPPFSREIGLQVL